MDWQSRMNRAIGYIDDNLTGEIDLAVAAKYAGCSTWEFQRVFSFMTHTSIGEYIRKRKMTLAAADIQNGNAKIIDIALQYGYDSAAAFSRAFNQLYGVSPSLARNDRVNLMAYPKITFGYSDEERVLTMKKGSDMERYGERGYYVKENAPVYFTMDMEKTCKWFRDVLGWYGDIVGKDEDGTSTYGCVFDYPGELIIAGLTPFRGIHMFHGAPTSGVVGFIMVQNLDKLHQTVKENGWNQITDIYTQDWGARECSVTTPDGSILRFFETAK